MPYVDIQSINGTFRVKAMSDASADNLSMQGGDPLYVEDAIYEAWLAHERERATFNKLWISIQDEAAQKREIYELRSKISVLEKYGTKP